MNLRLSSLFLTVALIAACLSVYRAVWEAGSPNHDFLLGVYLLLATASLVAGIPRNARFRAGFLGAALFAGLYLVCTLQGGFGLETIYDTQALARNTKLGVALMGVLLSVR